jgi:hypothetical protein
MGKFGKRKLPKFLELESTEALDENSNLSRNDRRAEIEALKAIGISTGNDPGKIIESYYRIEDLRNSGLENPPAKILWSDLWIKFIDIDYDEQIVNFKVVEDSIDMDQEDYNSYPNEDDMYDQSYGGTATFTTVVNDVEYSIECYISGNDGQFTVDDYMTPKLKITELTEDEAKRREFNNKPAAYRDRIEKNDPGYFSKIFNEIKKTALRHSAESVTFFIFDKGRTAELTVTDLEAQLDETLGDIIGDSGDMYSYDDVATMRFNSSTSPSLSSSPINISYHAYQSNNTNKANESFNSFLNECWSPIDESYVPGLSDSSKLAIKRLCEAVLIHEAHTHDMSDDSTQTYETYLNECYEYITECMMHASQKI